MQGAANRKYRKSSRPFGLGSREVAPAACFTFLHARNPDSNEGPRGSLNVPLTAGYSVAIDRKVIPLGSLLWLSTTRPDGSSLVRPVAAQDTGGAIAGEVRADLFWGTGEEAGHLAGDMKQKGNIWLLWPKGMALPAG